MLRKSYAPGLILSFWNYIATISLARLDR